MGKHNQKYIYNLARSVMGQAHVKTEGDGGHPQALWRNYGDKICQILAKMSPETRGKIAACGTISGRGGPNHWYVAMGEGLYDHKSGNELLTLLAAYVVTAAIAEVVMADERLLEKEDDNNDEAMGRFGAY